MQLRLIFSLMIFVGSYLPLSLILLVQNYDYAATDLTLCWELSREECFIPLKNPIFAIAVVAVCAACFAATLMTLSIVTPKHEVVIRSARHIPTELMNYTLPYVVSFMSYDYQELPKFSGLLIFLGWMFWITHKSGQALLNPLLVVFNWRLYEIEYRYGAGTEEHEAIALVRGEVSPGERRRHVCVQDVVVLSPA